jgi:hypothetical protein
MDLKTLINDFVRRYGSLSGNEYLLNQFAHELLGEYRGQVTTDPTEVSEEDEDEGETVFYPVQINFPEVISWTR